MAFAGSYIRDGWRVIATCRTPENATALTLLRTKFPMLEIVALDICNPESVATLAIQLDGRPIDLLLNNAGVNGPSDADGSAERQSFGSIDYAAWAATLEANTFGPMRVTEALIENVAASRRKQIIIITSVLGSIKRATGGKYGYRTSKAAANMLVSNLAHDLSERKVTVAAFCPGWVRTRMGGPSAPLQPEEAVAKVRVVIERLSLSDSGTFWNECGDRLPW